MGVPPYGREEEKILKREQRRQFGLSVFFPLLVLVIGAADARANGWRNPPEGAASLGKTGAKFALTDDPTAMTHNPANMVNVGPFSVLTSLMVINSETDFVGPRGRKGKTKDGWKYLGSSYAGAASEDGRLGYGIAITTPYGQSTQWSDDGPFAFAAPQFAQIRMIAVSPTVASKLNDWVDIGLGVNLYRSDISLRQLYAWSELTGDPLTPPGNAILKADGSSVGASVGMTLHVADDQRVAITYRSESTVTYEGDADFKNFPATLPSPVNQIASPSSRFATEITFPNILGFGYGIEFGGGLQFGVDVEWIEFSSFETLPLDVGSNQPLLPSSGIPQELGRYVDFWMRRRLGHFRYVQPACRLCVFGKPRSIRNTCSNIARYGSSSGFRRIWHEKKSAPNRCSLCN